MTDLETKLADALLTAAICSLQGNTPASSYIADYKTLTSAAQTRRWSAPVAVEGPSSLFTTEQAEQAVETITPVVSSDPPKRRTRVSKAAPPAEPETPEPETPAAPEPEPAAPVQEVTHEQLRKLFADHLETLKTESGHNPNSIAYRDSVKALVAEFKASAMSNLDKADLPAFHAKLLDLSKTPA